MTNAIQIQRQKAYDADEYDEKTPKEESEEDGAIERLTASVLKKREIAILARAACGIERDWQEDELAYDGEDEYGKLTRMIDYAAQTAPMPQSHQSPRRSRVVVNVIRGKCETASGRFVEILLPTDDRNWGLKSTPIPDLPALLENEAPVRDVETKDPILDRSGKQMVVADIAISDKRIADQKMAGMENKINDYLTECDYNSECMDAVEKAVRLGTGILKGPVPSGKVNRRWDSQSETAENGEPVVVRVLTMEKSLTPISYSVDPWNIFPDPDCGDDFRKAGYVWERGTASPRDLRDWLTQPGYREKAIRDVLDQEPQRLTAAPDKDDNNPYRLRYNHISRGSTYETWEFRGDLDKDDLLELGCACDEALTSSVSAVVLLVNDIPIKVELNPLETGELPYDWFVWSRRSGVPWGKGIPRQLMWQGRIMIAAWRAMMDNAGDSAGANFVVGDGVEPADDEWTVGGKKLWRATGDVDDVNKAFAQFQIANNQPELQAIIDMVLRFMDMETSIPMIFQGEKGKLPDTLGATNILVDSNNVALRSRVRQWDRRVTDPHLTRYYDWEMQFGEDDDIKGDYKVDARGVSVLLARDQEANDMKEIIAAKADPDISAMVDWELLMRQYFKARKLDVLLPKEKVIENKRAKEGQPQQPDPKTQGALQVAQMRAQGDLQKAQLVQQADMAELQLRAQMAQDDRAHEREMKMLDRDIKLMELASKQGIALDKIKADLSTNSQRLRTQVALATQETNAAEQVATPPTEPPGRAQEGKAFQQ